MPAFSPIAAAPVGGVASAGSAPVPTVTSITATPVAATVAGGSTTSIAIAVQGTNNPGQGFTSSKVSGVGSITGSAATMPAATTSAQSGTFRFRSTQDTNFFVDVVLTVAAVVAPPDPVEPGEIDATAVPAKRKIVFQGNKRVVTFPGNIREVIF